jgi:hypothetical protein
LVADKYHQEKGRNFMIFYNKELNKIIQSLRKENCDLKKKKLFFEESYLKIMTIQFLENHIKEVENYLKNLKKIIKSKKMNDPKLRLSLKNQKYVYLNYYDSRTKKSKSEYLGKYEDKKVKEKIDLLMKKHPEIKNNLNKKRIY